MGMSMVTALLDISVSFELFLLILAYDLVLVYSSSTIDVLDHSSSDHLSLSCLFHTILQL